ncbi:MAG: hypothetical protein DYG94_12925 [Leptolyngbya sp. PLA3]|nr:MAG: hypothetical protein EDM82_12225 [Cyanobacteria bacterium CYA]MCE7969628.1 hypothetical protein [Leptolyngbya sp. PL-A3]
MTRGAGLRVSAAAWRRLRVLRPVLVFAAIAVSLMFLYSGVEKWSNIGRFERIVVSHGLVGQSWAGAGGVVLACVEVGVGAVGLLVVLVVGPRLLSVILLVQATLFLGFAVYAALLTAKPPPEPTSCGCGVLAAPTADWAEILTRNAVAAAALGAGAFGAGCVAREQA